MIRRSFRAPAISLAVGATLLAATPAAAVRGQLTVRGTITAGSDDGNDLVLVDYVNGHLTEHYAPGTIFGTSGSLAGQAVSFTILYDPADPLLPPVAGGVFDDPSGEWALSLGAAATVNGVTHAIAQPPSGQAVYFAATATLGLVDGTPDGVTGNFTSGTYVATLLDNLTSSAFAFNAVLPSTFLSTDALLPGDVPGIHMGFAQSAATGTGSFTFTKQTCFIGCSSKAATATFDITSLAFAAVPEPAAWAMLVAGFGLVGAMGRRSRSVAVVAA